MQETIVGTSGSLGVQGAVPATLGTSLDADIASIKAYIEAEKAKAAAKEQALSTWFRKNWLALAGHGTTIVTILALAKKII
jgi:hypothetical protein